MSSTWGVMGGGGRGPQASRESKRERLFFSLSSHCLSLCLSPLCDCRCMGNGPMGPSYLGSTRHTLRCLTFAHVVRLHRKVMCSQKKKHVIRWGGVTRGSCLENKTTSWREKERKKGTRSAREIVHRASTLHPSRGLRGEEGGRDGFARVGLCAVALISTLPSSVPTITEWNPSLARLCPFSEPIRGWMQTYRHPQCPCGKECHSPALARLHYRAMYACT